MPNSFPSLPDPVRQSQYYQGLVTGRFLAWVIDAIVISILTAIAVLFTAFTAVLFLGVLSLAVSLTYRWLTLSFASATPGMQVMGIELRDLDGHRLNGTTAFWHSALFLFLKGMFVPLLISVAMMAGSRYGQGLHDAVCGVVAINRPRGRGLARA